MEISSRNKNEGFILKIVIIIVALVALKYVLHFDLIEWLKTDTAKGIYMPIWSGIKNLYFWIDSLFRSHAAN